MAIITGTSGADVLNGTADGDSIAGLEGNDQLHGGGGADYLDGGAGDDLSEGGEGDDTLRSTDGNDTLDGGAGDDMFDVLRGSGHGNLVTLSGGIGRDRFWLHSFGETDFVLDSGEGDDNIRVYAEKGDHLLTLGAGTDTVSVAGSLFHAASLSTTITDFTPGADGDRLDFNEFFLQNAPSWDGNQSPFALGFIRLVQSGADTLIEIDVDGGGNGYVEYLRLANVDAAALTYHNLDGFNSDGSIPVGLILNGGAGRDTIVGAGGSDLISGFGESDILHGGAGADTIRGGEGHDELHGEGGNDLLEGGAGGDRLYDGYGDDIVRGGADADVIISDTRGNDLLEGGGGNDHIDVRRGMNFQVTVDGGDGDDWMIVTAYSADNRFTVIGGAGNDTINSFSVAGILDVSLGSGSDEISLAWSGHSLLYSGHIIVSDFQAGAGGDRIDLDPWLGVVTDWDQAGNPFGSGYLKLVQSGADTLLQVDPNGGGDNLRTIVTFTGRDVSAFTPDNFDGFAPDGSSPPGLTLVGTSATETLTGGAGDDVIEGRGGMDTLRGMAGADLIVGGAESDWIEGGSGDDRIEGGGGNDSLDGGTGADLVYAGEGHDTVYVNNGADTVWAGGGDDTVHVQTSPPQGGTIAVHGEDGADTIRLLGSNQNTFLVADGGAGADTIEVGHVHGIASLTLGAGSDRLLAYGYGSSSHFSPTEAISVTDFAAGDGGDLIDLAGSLPYLTVGWDGSNPFDTRHVRLVQQGDDILVRFDRDGSGSDYDPATLFTLAGVRVGDLTAANFGFEPLLKVGPGGFSTLQAAIDAAQDGDIILVAPGTYVGNTNVNKGVAIFGPNQGIAGTGARGAEAVIDGMLTITASGVTIDGIKAVGRGVSPLGGHDAIAVLANDFTLTNTIFEATAAANGAVHTAQNLRGLTISHSLIQGYFNGIMVNPNVSGSIHDNRFQGGTGQLTLLNGLTSWSPQVAVRDNVFDSISGTSVALSPRSTATLDVNSFFTGNTIANSGVARPVLLIPTDQSRNITGTDFSEHFAGDTGQASYGAAGQAFSFDGRGGDDLAIGGTQGDSLAGGSGDDELSGNGGNDLLDGGAGADTMRGGTGDDIFFVDSSGDVVVENGGEGTDEVRTGLSVYSLAALPDVENLRATSGTPHDFRGNSRGNVVTGGAGNDVLRLYDGGNDTVQAGAGDDNIFFGATLTGADIVNGGAGTDTLVLQGSYAGGLTLGSNVTQIENVSFLAGSNTTFGEPGTNRHDYVLTTSDVNFAAGLQARVNGAALLEGEDFTFNGSAETDARFVVYGGKGRDTLTGGLGNDIFFYAEERFATGDTVNGGAGYDGMFLRGNYTIDFNAPGYTGLFTNIENLTLTSATDERYARGGGTEFDYNLTLSNAIVKPGETLTVSGALLMATETMILDAGQESDGLLRLFGGRANDTLKGGANADLIHGNLGADSLTGNGGADTFRIDSVAESSVSAFDQILDFAAGTDRIDLGRIDANSNAAGDQAFAWIGTNAFSGSAGELRARQDGTSWFVEGDVNGDGAADLVIQLTLQGTTPLGAGDFFL